jgi:2-polyprenyl-6-methoxyphenol hydroxylase-like FAD-dependent oxidoreductase
VHRNVLLQALEEELPAGTIRYSSKIVSIDQDEHGSAKILHLADGTTIRAKVLIGCDGINSVVAKWLGLAKPSDSGRLATRGLAHYPDGGHGFEPKILQLVGEGFRTGVVPTRATRTSTGSSPGTLPRTARTAPATRSTPRRQTWRRARVHRARGRHRPSPVPR